MYLVFETDNQHSYNSKRVIGLSKTREDAIQLCFEKAAKDGVEIDADQNHNLEEYCQTQGYAGDGEMMFESVEINELL